VNDVVEALAAALEPLSVEIPGLQITDTYPDLPTPPALDVYPDPGLFLERSAMGVGSWEAIFVVRARVATVDQQAAQRLLLAMMDPRDRPMSVIAALETDATLGGVVQYTSVESPSGYSQLPDPAGEQPFLGSIWRVRVVL
jgi:hypothetical protein